MGKNELTKVEALKLITPVVDDEVSSEERKAFFDFISDHEDVRRKYESIKKLKRLIHSRCPCAKAPDSLRTYLKKIQCEGIPDEGEAPIYDLPNSGGPGCHSVPSCDDTNVSDDTNRWWPFAIAASVLIAAAAWGFFHFSPNNSGSGNSIYNVEEYAYEHFKRNQGHFIQPTIATANLGSAEFHLASDYGISMTVPAIQNADFKGIVFSEFVPHYKSPMLEYYIPSENQYIYIFAFKVDKLKHFKNLVRDTEAVKTCNTPKDYHIRNVNGKHVVSWKWNDVWYAAISNHDGKTLASLVKPLQKGSQ